MGKSTGINNNNLKYQNRGLILKLIVTGECVTRIDLARRTRLSKMAVSNIVSEFLEQRIVEEARVEPCKGQGRNPICLKLSKKAPKIIGVSIHRDECTAVLCDMQMQVLATEREALNEQSSRRFPELLCSLIDKVMKYSDRIVGIGVGALGPLDIRKGMILNPPNFYGIQDVPVSEFLGSRYGLPVCLDHQYNSAALMEKFYGLGKEYHDFVFVGLTSGIGSGVVADDKILRSHCGLTSELGHVSIDYQGKRCICGNRGCLETYAGIRVVEEKLRDRTGRNTSFEEFCQCTQEEAVDSVFMEMAEHLACGFVTVANMLNPQAFIIGHEGYCIPDKYLEYMKEEINRRKLSSTYRNAEVRRSTFYNQAHLIGCACNIMNRIFEGSVRLGEEDEPPYRLLCFEYPEAE